MDEITNSDLTSVLESLNLGLEIDKLVETYSKAEANDQDAIIDDFLMNEVLKFNLPDVNDSNTVVKSEPETNEKVETQSEDKTGNHDIIIHLLIKEEAGNSTVIQEKSVDENEIHDFEADGDNFEVQNCVDIEMVINIQKCSKETSNSVCTIDEKSVEFEISVVKGEIKLVEKHQRLKCDVCLKFYSIKLQLVYQPCEGNDLPLFTCKECGKAFINKCNLKQHQMVHNKEWLYICEICGKGFKWKCTFKAHFKSHVDEKFYSCDECQKVFKFKKKLKEHLQTHREKKVNPFLQKKKYLRLRQI